jgi:hypothetical protein
VIKRQPTNRTVEAIQRVEIRRAAMKSRLISLLFVLVSSAACVKLPGGAVHGHVVAFLRGAEKGFPGSSMELPDARVTARNTTTNATSRPVPTNAHGYFQLPRLDAGTYQICAEAQGFTPSCLPNNVLVTNSTVVLPDPIQILPRTAFVAGRVLLADQRTPCFQDRPAFRTLLQAKVTLQGSGGTIVSGPVLANGIGQFVLPNVQQPGQFRLVGVCQSAVAEAGVNLGTAEAFQDLVIPNLPPQLQRVEETMGNQAVRVVPVGSTVTLHAVGQDPDGNPLAFKWVSSSGTVSGTSDTVQFTAPGNPSSTEVFVEANDDRGGFAYFVIPITGAPPEPALFAGTVVDATSGVPVAAAEVMVNGTPVTTDPRGMFTVRVPVELRYAISISKTGYALLSKATYAPAAELRLPLQPVTGVPFNATEGGKIESRDPDRHSLPAYLVIPPNGLADSNGNPATGPGTAYLWAYPPGTPIPGDMGAIVGGSVNRLETFGAVDVDLVDAGGQKLQVRQGGHLELSLTATAPNPPPTIPLFLFDAKTGMWMEHGTMTLSGNQYRGFIKHLTPFNADLAFGTTGCMEYHVDIENSPSIPFYLHIEQNGQTANHEPFQVSDFSGVVQRLRPSTQTDWWALPTPTSAKADAIGNGSFTSTNFTSQPVFGDLPPVGAKDAGGNALCAIVTLTASFPNHETFLTGLPGPNSPADETNYATAVDAWATSGSHATFTDFKATNGFPANDEATAVYFNNADLKLGRDMHCRVASGARVACYVSNYNDKAQPPAGSAPALLAAASAHTSGNANLLFATVAMEWDPSKPVDTSVQFWVYGAAGTRINEALLDSEGPKSVPQICVACHGGYYDDTGDHLAHAARFLPFDVASFRTVDDDFSAQAVTQLGLDPFTRQNQLGGFRALNAIVEQTEANRGLNPNAVAQLIDGWYQNCGGVTNTGCNACVGGAGCPDSFVSGFRPPNWQSANAPTQALYDNVVHPYCRGCHVMQGQDFNWTDPAQMTGIYKSSIQRDVCTNTQRRMPHAEVPFKAFWQGPTGPLQLTQAPLSLPACQR